MSTPELEQALAATKWKGVKASIDEVIAELLDVPVETVHQIIYAWEVVREDPGYGDDEEARTVFAGLDEGRGLDDGLRDAIKSAMVRGLRKTCIRWQMEHGRYLEVPIQKLVPETRKSDVCNGCPTQMMCVHRMLSTPQRCWSGNPTYYDDDDGKSRGFQYASVTVKPLKLEGNFVTVQADHPRGTYRVNIMDVRL